VGCGYVLHQIISHDDKIIRFCAPNVARGYIFARHLTFKYVGNGSWLLVRLDVRLRLVGLIAHMQQVALTQD